MEEFRDVPVATSAKRELMNHWSPISYRGFYDVPRVFLLEYKKKLFLFSCPFNAQIDEYPEVYKLYLMPAITAEELEGDWELYLKSIQHLGEIPVKGVQFDATKRREMNAAVIDDLLVTSQLSKH